MNQELYYYAMQNSETIKNGNEWIAHITFGAILFQDEAPKQGAAKNKLATNLSIHPTAIKLYEYYKSIPFTKLKQL